VLLKTIDVVPPRSMPSKPPPPRSECALLERVADEKHLREIINTAAEGVIMIDEKGRIVAVNSAAETMFGYTEAEALGMDVSELMPSPHRERHQDYLAAYRQTGTPKIIGIGRDLEALRKDGSKFPLHLRVAEVTVGDRRLYTGFMTDLTSRDTAQSALQEERNILSTILDTVAALVIVIDREGRIVRFNRACEQLTGYTFEEVKGRSVFELLLVPAEVPGVQRTFEDLLSAATPNSYENLWLTKSGATRRIDWSNTVLLDADGKVSHIIGTGIDVTERRKAEAAQRELTTRFVATFENAAVGIAHVSPEGRWLRVNQKLCEITGYPREELLTKTFADITYPADIEPDWEKASQLLRREVTSYASEKRYIHQNGSIIWANLTVSLVCSARGEPQYFISVIEDITKRKEAEFALRDSEEHLRRVLDSLYVFVGVLSPQGTLLHASQPPLDAAGITWDEVKEKPFWECYWWSFSPASQRHLRYTIEKASVGIPSRYDVDIRVADDKRMTIDFMLSPMRNDLGQVTHLIASAVDITSRKQLEREVLDISEREQRRIGQDLHDDLCQRLTATEFLAHSVASDLSTKLPAYAMRVGKIAEYIRGAISHTRLLARGLSPVRLSDEGLITALRELAASTEELFNICCNLNVEAGVAVENPETGSQLYRITQEAISNAIRHGRATLIEITLERFEDRLRMIIADDGCGIPRTQPSNDGMGLRIMQHRAGIISATLEIRPGETTGTQVVCTFSR
jgi:PAS domain S-box-containing protein